MKTQTYLLAVFIMMHYASIMSAATWKVFLYADSSDNLSDMIIKNITDIIRGKPNDSVDFVIQLHAYYMTGLRYRVTEQGLAFIEEIQLSYDNQQNFINGAQWAFANNSADHTMLIISDHGWGILDPQWNEHAEEWQVNEGGLSNNCMIEKSNLPLMSEQHKRHKGFLFTVKPRSYLANQKLFEGLSYITTHILNDKLDIIAFDTCMGNMLEIGYGIAPYAHYLVGSQSCSLPDGFAYKKIIDALNQQQTPRDIARSMVQAFDAYYKSNDESGIYTHAALDLSQIYAVCEALDTVIDNLLTMPEYALVFLQACNNSPRFCLWPMYTDVVAWAKNVQFQLTSLPKSDNITSLHTALHNFYQSAVQLVVARCGGHATQGLAHGFAIYLPTGAIDDSYYTTSFAQESRWVKFLEFIRYI